MAFDLAARLAERRAADCVEEADAWRRHLENQGISEVSPGLLFIRRREGRNVEGGLDFRHELLPKTDAGSIWTPTNPVGRDFTKAALEMDGFLE